MHGALSNIFVSWHILWNKFDAKHTTAYCTPFQLLFDRGQDTTTLRAAWPWIHHSVTASDLDQFDRELRRNKNFGGLRPSEGHPFWGQTG